jgi:hypothetical protein
VEKLLACTVWLNMHALPPFEAPRYVLEARTQQVRTVSAALRPQPRGPTERKKRKKKERKTYARLHACVKGALSQ